MEPNRFGDKERRNRKRIMSGNLAHVKFSQLFHINPKEERKRKLLFLSFLFSPFLLVSFVTLWRISSARGFFSPWKNHSRSTSRW